MSWLLFLAALLMGLVSADSITRERREGTLGLLLLTDLTPREIVWGKMLSCGLTSFLVLLGSLPALMFPVLAGGVTGSEAALTGLGLLNTLFVSLAAGLWMSSGVSRAALRRGRQRWDWSPPWPLAPRFWAAPTLAWAQCPSFACSGWPVG